MEFKKLYAIAKTLADFIKDEYPERNIPTSLINQFCNSDYYAKLLLSKIDNEIARIQVVYIIYFIIKEPDMSQDDIIRNINNLYVVEIDWYDDEINIKEECGDCEGTGYNSCDLCDGEGQLKCGGCDGDGNIDCDSCDGEGSESCRECGGSGTQTEVDDEGDQIEVDCDSCDGNGEIRCESCGGTKSFECEECRGKGTEECDDCGGSGEVYCYYCSGNGEVDSDELYYDVTSQKIVTIGNRIASEVGNTFEIDEFETLDADNGLLINEYTITQRYYKYKKLTSEELRSSRGVDEHFVTINWVTKLDDYITF